MFGYLRFFLAFLVLLSHIDVRVYGLNPGVIAVVIFYMLAGYVVSHLFYDVLPSTHKLTSFYKDRLLRIFPLYLYISIVTLIFLGLSGFGTPHLSLKNLLANALIIPLNYYMYFDFTILKEPNWWLIPPAWSLGTELQAYILLPIALIFRSLKIVLAIVSFLVYIAANASWLHPEYFGYRFVVGVFFIFLIGSMIQYRRTHQLHKLAFEKLFPYIVWVVTAVLMLFYAYTNGFSLGYTKETFIGILFGMPLVMIISQMKRKLAGDAFLGSLSYAIFLSHFLVIWILQHFGYFSTSKFTYVFFLTLLSLLIGYIGVTFVEKPLQKIRHYRRNR